MIFLNSLDRAPSAPVIAASIAIQAKIRSIEIYSATIPVSATEMAVRPTTAVDIMANSMSWGVGWAWPEEIDALNIHKATLLAMKRAFGQISAAVTMVYVDGKFSPALPVPTEAVIKGDSKIHEIMAASILAKVFRDRWMIRYSLIDPEYGYEKHKGYPTPAHRESCLRNGPSAIQRHSFTVKPFED